MSLRVTIPEKVHEIFERSYVSDSQKDLKDLTCSIQSVLEEVQEINSLLNSRNPDMNMLKEITAKKEKVYGMIREMWTQPAGVQFDIHHPVFTGEISNYIDRLPKKLTEEQPEERFECLDTDNWQIRIKKRIKIFIYRLSVLPKKAWNSLRRLFKKNPLPVRFWSHTIPVKNAVRMAYQSELIRKLVAIESRKFRGLLENIIGIKSLDNGSDLVLTYNGNKFRFDTVRDPDAGEQIDEVVRQINATARNYRKLMQETISEADRMFAEIMDQAGTIEMPARYLRNKRINRKINRFNTQWLNNSQDWSRTLYALFDDWRLDLEINRLKYFSYHALFQAKRKLNREKKEHLSSLEGLSTMLGKIEGMVKTGEGLTRNKLYEIKNFIRKYLDAKMVPEVISRYELKKLTVVLDDIIEKIEEEINSISETRALVKADHYLQPLKEKEVNYIKPNELISFEVFPHFRQQAEQLRKTLESQHEEIVRLLPDLDNIVIFSIDTAVNATSPEEEVISKQNMEIILNGIVRATNRISDFKQMTERLFNDYDLHLFEAVSRFTTDAVLLMQNENAIAIRIKLLKAKALHRTRKYGMQFRYRMYRQIIRIRHVYRDKSAVIFRKLGTYRKRYLLHATDAIITREISDFLRESTDMINRLPVIYRRLYHVDPLTDMELFVGRAKEFSDIRNDYQKWRDGRPLSLSIVGEKWGGLSSFVNYLMVNLNPEHPIIRITPTRKYYQPNRMHQLLAVYFSLPRSAGQQEIIKGIRSSASGKVVIIEDLQHFFIRSFHGFESLRSLVQIIKQTNREVFWVCTCTRYAWNYLVKSFQVDDLFQNVIEIGNMSSEEIGAVIQKRNLIGGFRIQYQPPGEYSESKKFSQLDPEEQQRLLEKRFFKRMNEFSQSNISMALIYWLLSTKEVTDDKILVGDFENPDHSYLHAMSQARTYILLALILHDGLSLPDLARVNNQTAGDLQFHITCLQEDGIVEIHGDQYLVNPLIYRPVVNVLTSKNLIH